MLVLPTTKHIGYRDDFRKFFKFKRFEKDCGDFVLVEGFFEQAHQWEQFNLSSKKLKKILAKRLVRIEIEEPNKFALNDNNDSYDYYFEKIYTICPFTADWLNKKHKNKKRVPIYYPTNEEYIPRKTKKLFDIIYVGNIVSNKVLKDVEVISKYNYRFVSFYENPLVTNKNASYKQKLKLISQSRITLVHNLLFPPPYRIINIWRTKGWQENKAFKLVPPQTEFWRIFTNKNILIPQIKSRLFDAALCRSLILCKKDPFNIIENFFEPNEEFVYYEEGKLKETIDKILENYKKYGKVADNAFKRASKNYTTKAFVRDYLSKL